MGEENSHAQPESERCNDSRGNINPLRAQGTDSILRHPDGPVRMQQDSPLTVNTSQSRQVGRTKRVEMVGVVFGPGAVTREGCNLICVSRAAAMGNDHNAETTRKEL